MAECHEAPAPVVVATPARPSGMSASDETPEDDTSQRYHQRGPFENRFQVQFCALPAYVPEISPT